MTEMCQAQTSERSRREKMSTILPKKLNNSLDKYSYIKSNINFRILCLYVKNLFWFKICCLRFFENIANFITRKNKVKNFRESKTSTATCKSYKKVRQETFSSFNQPKLPIHFWFFWLYHECLAFQVLSFHRGDSVKSFKNDLNSNF